MKSKNYNFLLRNKILMAGPAVYVFFAFAKVVQQLIFHPKPQDLGLDPEWDSGTRLPCQKSNSELHIHHPYVKHRESYRPQIWILKLVCWVLSGLGYPLRTAEYMLLSFSLLQSSRSPCILQFILWGHYMKWFQSQRRDHNIFISKFRENGRQAASFSSFLFMIA